MEEVSILTKEQVASLEVNEVEVMQKIASELSITLSQVSAVISLVKEGCTIPFISRYRKEKHGNLDEVQVRNTDHLFTSYCNLEQRRIDILKSIVEQDKMTSSLQAAIQNAQTLTVLEDLYAPFKKKKKTRGMIAIEKGLDPLADLMLKQTDDELQKAAEQYIKIDAQNEALNVPTKEDALNGAKDIVAERVSQDTEARKQLMDFYLGEGKITTKGIGDEAEQKTSVYQMYWDYAAALSCVKPHAVLAINRGEKEGILDVTVEVDTQEAVKMVQKKYGSFNHYLTQAAEDGVIRLLSPSIVREIRGNLTQIADDHSIGIFGENLKNLLMTPPLKKTRVLGVDPGIRTGTKCAALDETGKYLGYFLIRQVAEPEAAKTAIKEAIQKYDIQVVAVGNGTGSPQVQEIVSNVIKNECPQVNYTVVDESGASVYSASDIARDEFPELDLTVRGAISMGRRLQDPLSELVKIDPKSIGVGLYQHDVNQTKLSSTLDEVVGSVVNNVGVNLNTASYSLLKYVSGITTSTAKKIVAYRNANGMITKRSDLMNVPGLGPKAYEQCAGFLKIPESLEPLDNTWVHPENYALARELLPFAKENKAISNDFEKDLEKKYDVGEQTISDIIAELKKPNLDPRDSCPAVIMQKEAKTFEDLKIGQKVQGKIRNVVDFGAFVDIGLHEMALVHISELSDSFVKNPLDVLKVGDVREFTIIDLDKDRKRISLSLRSDPILQGKSQEKKEENNNQGGVPSDVKKKKVVIAKAQTKAKTKEKSPYQVEAKQEHQMHTKRSFSDDNDGLTYNPFIALLKK